MVGMGFGQGRLNRGFSKKEKGSLEQAGQVSMGPDKQFSHLWSGFRLFLPMWYNSFSHNIAYKIEWSQCKLSVGKICPASLPMWDKRNQYEISHTRPVANVG